MDRPTDGSGVTAQPEPTADDLKRQQWAEDSGTLILKIEDRLGSSLPEFVEFDHDDRMICQIDGRRYAVGFMVFPVGGA